MRDYGILRLRDAKVVIQGSRRDCERLMGLFDPNLYCLVQRVSIEQVRFSSHVEVREEVN